MIRFLDFSEAGPTPGQKPWKGKKVTAAGLLKQQVGDYSKKNFGLLGAYLAAKLGEKKR